MLDDFNDPENDAGGSNVRMARGNDVTAAALAILRSSPTVSTSDYNSCVRQEQRRSRMVRAYIASLNLTAPQLYQLVLTTDGISRFKGVVGFRELPDDAPKPDNDCTYGEWRSAVGFGCDAAAALLAETFQPIEFDDFMALVRLVHVRAWNIPISRRNKARLLKRLQANLANAFYGIRVVDYGMPSFTARERSADQAAKKAAGRKAKPTPKPVRQIADRAPGGSQHASA